MKLDIDERELATILAALRFYEDVRFRKPGISWTWVEDIATDAGRFILLDRDEIDRLCIRLNTE